jgi:hypothetical protein
VPLPESLAAGPQDRVPDELCSLVDYATHPEATIQTLLDGARGALAWPANEAGLAVNTRLTIHTVPLRADLTHEEDCSRTKENNLLVISRSYVAIGKIRSSDLRLLPN